MRNILFFLLIFFANITFAQRTVNGLISDKNNNPIKGVKVSVKYANTKTVTNIAGKYSIEIPEGKNILEFSKNGFKTQTVEINSDNINLTLASLADLDLLELSLEELANLKVTSVSKKNESARETPQTVIVITKDEIQSRGYSDIEQIFHDLPGFDISRSVGTEYSQIYQRGYRSNNTDRTLFLVDGVEENDLWSNSTWISLQHSISNIERIEIIYGPASTIYGANAFLGVVNIITKDASSVLKGDNKFGVNAQAGYGTWNTWYEDITAATKSKDFSLVVTSRVYQSAMPNLSKYKDWDYNLSDRDLNFYKKVLGTDNTMLAQSAMDLDQQAYYHDPELGGIPPQYSNNKKDWYFNAKMHLGEFTLGTQIFKNVEGYGAWYTDDYELGPKNGGSWGPLNYFVYAKYDKKVSQKLTITSFSTFRADQLKGNTNEEFYFIGYLNGGLGLNNLLHIPDTAITWNNQNHKLDTSISYLNQKPYWFHSRYHTYSQQFRSELEALYNFNDKLSVISGLEFRQGLIQGNYINSNTEYPEETGEPIYILGGNHFVTLDLGLFAQANYNVLDNLNMVLGTRADYNQIRIHGGYGMSINPKAAIVFTPDNFIFKAIYSEAFKDASMWDKYGTTPGRLLNNPTLKPEKVRNYELSVGWKIGNNLFLDIAGYNANYSNAIGTAVVTYVQNGETITTTQNQAIGQYRIQGLQSTLNYKYENYSAYANYTFTSPYSIHDDDHKVRIGDIASHSINGGVSATYFRKLNINLRANYVGERLTGANTTISDNPYNHIDPYFILNGAISYSTYKGITIQLNVNNIFDTKYFDPGVRSADGSYYAARSPQFERNLMLKLFINY